MVKTKFFEVVCGSYEEFLVGYNFSTTALEFTQSFAAHDHASSIRSLALCDHYLASGGADDRIFIYDMKSRKLHCSLIHHDAAINCLQFTPNHSHLISGSADGVLAIVRLGNWQLEKVWDKAHKGAAILDIAVHNSGKLALTLGADHTLCTWNLVKGRQAYIINLNTKCKDVKSIEKILWASDGVRFILYGGKYTEIWSIEIGGILKQIEHKEKVISCVWLSDSSILVGHENGEITKIDLEHEDRVSYKAHESRVKSIAIYKKWIVSVSSSGDIKIWNSKMKELAKYETGCRLTCLCIVPQTAIKNEIVQTVDVEETINETPKTPMRARVIETVDDDDDDDGIEENQTKIVKKKKKKKLKPDGKKVKKLKTN